MLSGGAGGIAGQNTPQTNSESANANANFLAQTRKPLL